MGRPALTQRYGCEILEVLGIDCKGVLKAVITIEVNDVICVDVTRFAQEPETGALGKIHSQYLVSAHEKVEDGLLDVTTFASTEREYRKAGP